LLRTPNAKRRTPNTPTSNAFQVIMGSQTRRS
jgi:hypothetical protein